MADYYIDPSTGDDTTGAGTSGSPWATLQKGIDNANGGDTIHLANTAADVVTSQITWTSFGATTPTSEDNPLMIVGWDNGGSITISSPISTITGVGEINTAGQSFSPLFSTSSQPNFVLFHRIKFTGSGSTGNTSVSLRCRIAWSFYECEFEADRNGAYAIGDGQDVQVIGCYFHSDGIVEGNGVLNLTYNNRGSNVAYCYFEGLKNHARAVVGGIHHCVFNTSNTADIVLDDVRGGLFGNTIYSSDALTTTMVEIQSSFVPVMNNVIVGASGVGGVGIAISGGGGTPWMLGNNHFYNNTTNMSATPRFPLGTDQTTDPTFTDAAGGDFSVGSNAQGKGYAGLPGSSTVNYLNMGAVQEQAGTGTGATNVAAAKFTRLE